MGIIVLIAILAGSAYLVYKAVNGGFESLVSRKHAEKPQSSTWNQAQRPQQSTYRPQQATRITQGTARPQQGARCAQSSAQVQQAQSKKSKYNLPSAY